jgi:hypothetical protein
MNNFLLLQCYYNRWKPKLTLLDSSIPVLNCYTFVLRAEIVTIFEPKMVTISARNTNIYKICKLNLQDYIFQALQHFVTKFCNFTTFIMFFLAVVFDSLLFT